MVLFRFPLVTVDNAASPIVPQSEALVRMALIMKNGLVGVAVAVAVARVRAMNDLKSLRGVAGGRRNLKKRYGSIRNRSLE